MTNDQRRARRRASLTIRKAQRRYEQAEPGYRRARWRALHRTMTKELERELAPAA